MGFVFCATTAEAAGAATVTAAAGAAVAVTGRADAGVPLAPWLPAVERVPVVAEAALNCTPWSFGPALETPTVVAAGAVVLAAVVACWTLTYLLPALVAAGPAVDDDTSLVDGWRAEDLPLLPLADEDPLTWLLGGAALLDAESSAWATPEPPASAAPKPSVIAPAPSHAYGSRWRCGARCRPFRRRCKLFCGAG